jgi:cobaltochelatase CobN
VGEAALLLTCRGCCCGHPESGGPKTAPRALRAELRRAHREAGLEGTLRLAFSDCLGPCSEANVLFLSFGGRSLWFRRMNDRSLCESLLGWVRQAVATPTTPLPPALGVRTFRWAGGGEGPEPPVGEPEE